MSHFQSAGLKNLKSDYHCCKDGLGGAGVAIKGKKGCCFGRLYDLAKYTCFFDGGRFYIRALRTGLAKDAHRPLTVTADAYYSFLKP